MRVDALFGGAIIFTLAIPHAALIGVNSEVSDVEFVHYFGAKFVKPRNRTIENLVEMLSSHPMSPCGYNARKTLGHNLGSVKCPTISELGVGESGRNLVMSTAVVMVA